MEWDGRYDEGSDDDDDLFMMEKEKKKNSVTVVNLPVLTVTDPEVELLM